MTGYEATVLVTYFVFSLAYFVEKDNTDSKYTSIPESMWWAIQTMTSVSFFFANQIMIAATADFIFASLHALYTNHLRRINCVL